MKFKSLFLTMLGATVMFSCNNEIIDGGEGPTTGGGPSTHATFSLDFGKKVGTYAGGSGGAGVAFESNVSDAAIYIYDAANAPEAMAYLPNAQLATPRNVTLKVSAGAKKIFVALNIGHGTPPILPQSGFTTSAKDTGVVFTNTFAALNNILYSTPADITLTAPTAGTEGGSTGLIKTLAGGAIAIAKGGIYSTDAALDNTALTGSQTFMSNWDGPSDGSTGTTYTSDCSFTLTGNISKDQSQVATNPNYLKIGVQRAYAKVSLRITASGDTQNNTAGYVGPYESATNKSQGRFEPWQDAGNTTNIWSLGGINKNQYPFQQFAGANEAVASPNYALTTGDTIFTATPATSDKWYSNYDNTRVFGTGKKYFTTANTVASVKGSMSGANNYLGISPADGNNLRYAFATENGTEYPQLEDKATFAIIGGNYKPKNVLTSILKPGTSTLPADKGWNSTAAVAGTPNSGYDVGTYPTLTYGATDSLYYIRTSSDTLFIFGKANLAGYVAWELKVDVATTTPQTSTAVTDAITAYLDNGAITAYSQGQCFYRVWVRDRDASSTSTAEDEVLVRRNHIYDVNITKILGPGIGDPNKIITPGQPIPDLETFVTVEINILEWHKVTQDEEVENK